MASGAACVGSIPIWCVKILGNFSAGTMPEIPYMCNDFFMGENMTSLEKRKKELKKKKMLIMVWVIFIILAGAGIVLYATNYKEIKKAVNVQHNDKKIYETNSNLDINVLISTYLNALTDCDQKTLQTLVTNPSQFDNMTVYLSRAQNVIGYSHIDCYTLKGKAENEYLCYVIANVSLKDVKSTPKDIMVYYIIKKNDEYLIYNDMDNEVDKYIDEMTLYDDIQELYKIVKDDEDNCYNTDKTLREFYEKLNTR